MKVTKPLLFMALCVLISSQALLSQTDKEQISAIRNASNAALRSYDNEKVLSYVTDDVVTTTGNGVLLCGKKELEAYILAGGKSTMYWIRDTKELTVYAKRGLAWESGIWNGYTPEKGNDSVVNGKYAAMWTKASGIWKIKSQLFVTTGEN